MLPAESRDAEAVMNIKIIWFKPKPKERGKDKAATFQVSLRFIFPAGQGKKPSLTTAGI